MEPQMGQTLIMITHTKHLLEFKGHKRLIENVVLDNQGHYSLFSFALFLHVGHYTQIDWTCIHRSYCQHEQLATIPTLPARVTQLQQWDQAHKQAAAEGSALKRPSARHGPCLGCAVSRFVFPRG